MVKKKAKEVNENESVQTYQIPPLNFKYANITIIGETPLLVNAFSHKAKTEITETQLNKAKSKKQRDPEQEFKASLYPIPGKVGCYGVPAGGLKKCAVSACRFIEGISMSIAKGAFHVIAGPGNLVEIKGTTPVMDESIVRIGKFGNKQPSPRYRARFDKWEITFAIKFNAGVISAEQILNLYENAGFAVGLCEWRPEKDGSLGMFKVKRAA